MGAHLQAGSRIVRQLADGIPDGKELSLGYAIPLILHERQWQASVAQDGCRLNTELAKDYPGRLCKPGTTYDRVRVRHCHICRPLLILDIVNPLIRSRLAIDGACWTVRGRSRQRGPNGLSFACAVGRSQAGATSIPPDIPSAPTNVMTIIG